MKRGIVLSTSFARVSTQLAGRSRLIAASVVIAAGCAALLLGDSHPIAMIHH